MESLADRVAKEVDVCDVARGCRIRNQRKYPVVGCYEDRIDSLCVAGECKRPTRTSDAGIHNDNMDRTIREIPPGFIKDKGRLENVIRRDVVSDIDDLNVRSNSENDAFHGSHKGILQAEIRS